jgi:hypothetical protein
MSMTTDCRSRSGRLTFVIICIVAAGAYLGIGLARGETGFAIAGPLTMLVYCGVLLVLGRRAEPAELLSGKGTDERQQQIMTRALATTGLVLVCAIVIGAMVTLAAGAASANALCALCGVGGVTFVASTLWHARRS